MSTTETHVLRPGVYAPILTPYKDEAMAEIDLHAFSHSVARLAKADVGMIVAGTLGEGPLLDQEERKSLVKCARDTLSRLQLESRVPLIMGVMGAGVRECTRSSKEAAEAGADAIVLVAPSYFAFVYGKDKSSVRHFFTSVADESPLPVLIYNIPFAAGGIDLDPYDLMTLSEHQNIAGVKLTCGNIAKGHRLALHVNDPEYRKRHSLPFLVLPGSTDYMLPALIARQHGCMGGPANLYPKVCVSLYRIATEALASGDGTQLRQAQELQDLVTSADSVINKVGFLGIKTGMTLLVDERLGGNVRKPLLPIAATAMQELQDGLGKIMDLEASL